jgi:hypothetical protein
MDSGLPEHRSRGPVSGTRLTMPFFIGESMIPSVKIGYLRCFDDKKAKKSSKIAQFVSKSAVE